MLFNTLTIALILAATILALSTATSVFGCFNAPNNECPIWPAEFSAPFGMYTPGNNQANISSVYYFKQTDDILANLIDYPEGCVPVNAASTNHNVACKLLFTATDTYLTMPDAGVECCTLLD